eukprot:m.223792 g.223792  ORF g.223792 m.223792 type:complete len:170 (+) comp17027_c0_seq12:61-570(+)
MPLQKYLWWPRYLFSDAVLTCVAMTHDGEKAIVCDGAGHAHLFDMKARRPIGLFGSGPFSSRAVGSIRSVSLHPTLDFVAFAGLDRHIRVFNVSTRKLQSKIFLKQRLNHVLFTNEEEIVEKTEEEVTEDVMWETLQGAEEPSEDAPKKAKVQKEGKVGKSKAKSKQKK